MHRVLAMILAGGMGDRLSVLAVERAKPAVPFGGRYRIIDFTLSNCVNSGINSVVVLAQYAPISLARHLSNGRPWGLDNVGNKGLTLLQPYVTRTSRGWFEGTADAVYRNLGFINRYRVRQVLILAGDHIYTMKYDQMIAFHRHHKADLTVGVIEVSPEDAHRFGILKLDDNDEVISFEEKPDNPKSNMASMGIYVFNKNTLSECLEQDSHNKRSKHDFGGDIIPSCLGSYKLMGYRFEGYWRDVGTIESYWQANMDLIQDPPPLNLYDPETEILTGLRSDPPAKFGSNSLVNQSLISDGAIIKGTVRNSVISPNVFVEESAVVEDSIILDRTRINRDAKVHRCIIDKDAWIGHASIIGTGDDFTRNKDGSAILNTGINVIGKGARIPSGTKMGRNCKIESWVRETDFTSTTYPSGTTIERLSGT